MCYSSVTLMYFSVPPFTSPSMLSSLYLLYKVIIGKFEYLEILTCHCKYSARGGQMQINRCIFYTQICIVVWRLCHRALWKLFILLLVYVLHGKISVSL